jgi:protein-S-isoprenylcysteine O-methyltransferase Ste14
MMFLALSFVLFYAPLSKVPVLGLKIIPRHSGVAWAGVAMCAAGTGFAIWARHYLAGNWSGTVTLKEGHSLIQSGPYAIVRHPIYSGILFAMLGTALAVGELRAFPALLGALGIWKKMNQEEALMRKAFPGEYADYEQRVKKLVPGIL